MVFALLRSRGTRERILISFAGARNRHFYKTANFIRLQIGHTSKFFQGLWASFSCLLDTKTRLGHCYSVFFGFFRTVRRFEVFFELVIILIAFDKKGNAVPVQTGLRFFDLRRKKNHDIIPKHVHIR